MAKKLTPAQRRTLLSKPARSLSASEMDTRRELIAAGRVKTTGPAKKKKKSGGSTLGTTIKAIKRRGRHPK